IRQVRRALATYGGTYRNTSARRARYSAQQLAKQFVPAELRKRERVELRERLIDAIVDATGGGTFDRDALLEVARRVFDPAGAGRSLGPPGTTLTAELWVRTVEARLTTLERLDVLEDAAFDDTRVAHHQHLAEYQVRQPELARDPELGVLFEPATFENRLNHACRDL